MYPLPKDFGRFLLDVICYSMVLNEASVHRLASIFSEARSKGFVDCREYVIPYTRERHVGQVRKVNCKFPGKSMVTGGGKATDQPEKKICDDRPWPGHKPRECRICAAVVCVRSCTRICFR